eukprot:14196928-Ditylum_brightwellii.AAC.1
MFPGKIMVPVMDNAPYHHKRVLGSLNSLSIKKLIELAQEHGCDYLELPYTKDQYQALENDDEDAHSFIEDLEEGGIHYQVKTEGQWDMLAKVAAKSWPFCPTKEEMQIAL